ncbi:MAG: hypothetical protein CL885_03115 [Dehalococcoidia bacterium]|nr:hypothetical protein [Dehalococcoidia bacterium]|tara:strand:- start:262 stop:468 length:207 start_codon:yes stop_codon:yes gene_type:complete
MKKLITKDTIKRVIEQYKRYKLSLSEEYVIESIANEIADELRRKFIIEPVRTYAKQKKGKTKSNASDN